jgi:hypothetical protein
MQGLQGNEDADRLIETLRNVPGGQSLLDSVDVEVSPSDGDNA